MVPRLASLNLADTDREQLERWARAGDNRRPLALRARIVLCCHAGCSNRESARRLKLTPQTVGKWRARFLAHGVQGLADHPRSGAPRTISDALEIGRASCRERVLLRARGAGSSRTKLTG